MNTNIKLFLVITGFLNSNVRSLQRQLLPIGRRSFYQYDPRELSGILGSPSLPSHLPEAEAILPGHTLIKPAMGMLKSSVKFPHRDLEDGSGVYGNYENIGIRYDSKNERVLYSGFRRSSINDIKSDGNVYLKKIYSSKIPIKNTNFDINKTRRNNIFEDIWHELKKVKSRLGKKAKEILTTTTTKQPLRSKDIEKEFHEFVNDIKSKLFNFFESFDDKQHQNNQRRWSRRLNKNRLQIAFFGNWLNRKTKRRTTTHNATMLTTVTPNTKKLTTLKGAKATTRRTYYQRSHSHDFRNENSNSRDAANYDEDALTRIMKKYREHHKKKRHIARTWNAKNTFNHISLDLHAPEYSEIFPHILEDNQGQWFFFSPGAPLRRIKNR